ncbi:MAG: hypothetical protein IJV60_06745 [Prevotella sp.]|nr:hypothetical protein [Prevotella sp.]MBQ8059792.1 hypothetical protein [Prevotella sp.]
MKRNTYITPEIKTCLLNIPSLMAGSYIEKGSTDGQGSGKLDAPAKQGSSLFDTENEEDITTTW